MVNMQGWLSHFDCGRELEKAEVSMKKDGDVSVGWVTVPVGTSEKNRDRSEKSGKGYLR